MCTRQPEDDASTREGGGCNSALTLIGKLAHKAQGDTLMPGAADELVEVEGEQLKNKAEVVLVLKAVPEANCSDGRGAGPGRGGWVKGIVASRSAEKGEEREKGAQPANHIPTQRLSSGSKWFRSTRRLIPMRACRAKGVRFLMILMATSESSSRQRARTT